MWTVEECKFRDGNGICHCLSRWKKAAGKEEPFSCPFASEDLSDVCIDFEPKQSWAGGIGWIISCYEPGGGEKSKDVRPKPTPRQWARWAGYDCGE